MLECRIQHSTDCKSANEQYLSHDPRLFGNPLHPEDLNIHFTPRIFNPFPASSGLGLQSDFHHPAMNFDSTADVSETQHNLNQQYDRRLSMNGLNNMNKTTPEKPVKWSQTAVMDRHRLQQFFKRLNHIFLKGFHYYWCIVLRQDIYLKLDEVLVKHLLRLCMRAFINGATNLPHLFNLSDVFY
jgi:hypothetical protein